MRGGSRREERELTAKSRKSHNMEAKLPERRASVMVLSKTAGKSIMVERSMYWNDRGSGTDTIGAYPD